MNIQSVMSRLAAFEGRVPHMYVCTGGKVTVGIGHVIPTVEDAIRMPWTVAGRTANRDEIQRDYEVISGAPRGQVATSYAPLTRCRMAEPAIETIAGADVLRFSMAIAGALPRWDRYPDCVQEALFDMGFNVGVGGLLKFGRLLAACDAGDWDQAARECHRQGIAESRNLETAALIRQAIMLHGA